MATAIETPQASPWLSLAEACRYLKVSRRTLYRQIELGHLKRYYIGDLPRFRVDELDELMRAGPPPARAPTQRQKDGTEAERIIEEMGAR